MLGFADGVRTVAKRKATRKTPPAGRESWKSKPLIAAFRGSEEFKGWLQRFAEFDRQTVAGLMERALVQYARSTGFDEPAPER